MANPLLRLPLKIMGEIRSRRYEYNHRRRINDLLERGLTVGKNVVIDPETYIDYNYPFLISIGDNSILCAGTCVLAHDATILRWTGGMKKLAKGHTRVGRVVIRENCILSVNCVILPGVTIGPNVLVGAGSVVTRDIPPNSCVAGVPARFYDHWDKLMGQHEAQLKSRPVFDSKDLEGNKAEETKKRLKEAVKDGDAYLRGYVGEYPYFLNEVEEED